MLELYVGSRKVLIDLSKPLGDGNEAVVVDIGGGLAAKIFKEPDHPDYKGNLLEQEVARHRIQEHQKKLLDVPKNMGTAAVTPIDLLRKSNKQIAAYTMSLKSGLPLFRYGQPDTRVTVPFDFIKATLLNLNSAVAAVHAAPAVIGDFSDRNVLVSSDASVWLIDTDSWQFGKWQSHMFTDKFLDPLLSSPDEFMLIGKHNSFSDWYAYCLMVYETLTSCPVYFGKHRPEDKTKTVKNPVTRVMKRMPAWAPDIYLPDVVLKAEVLPDDLMDFIDSMVVKNVRKPFPKALLENLEEKVCSSTGKRHFRARSPYVAATSPHTSMEKTTIIGNLTATRMFQTVSGAILNAAVNNGVITYLFHDNGKLYREKGRFVCELDLDPNMRFRISGSKTIIAYENQVAIYAGSQGVSKPKYEITDTYQRKVSVVAANSKHYYWTSADTLFRSDDMYFGTKTREEIGTLLSGQSQIWVGETFGFGFYRQDGLSQAFVFDASLADSLKMVPEPPQLHGELLDASCAFSDTHLWFTTVTQEGSQTMHRCFIYTADGMFVTSFKQPEGEEGWLESIRGYAAFGDTLFVPSTDGVQSVRFDGSTFQVHVFSETARYVGSASHLFIATTGLYAVTQKEVYLLKMQ